jgi:gluconolactonase
MTLDADGNLVACEHVTSSVVREKLAPDGTAASRETIATHYDGKELNSPNDVIVADDGSVYFSDPWYGRMPVFGVERDRELDFCGVYRLPSDGGELELLVDDFEMPNGLCFSPDRSLLYINDTPRAHIRVFEVRSDGSIVNGEMFFEGIGTGVIPEGIPDGMKCDELGNVWVTGPGGVWVLTPDGEHLGTVATPEVCGSIAWGGEDLHSLFLMTSTSVHVVRTLVGPPPLPGA